MRTNNELLIRLAREVAKTMSLPDADIVNKLCTQLDCALAAARTACGERTAALSTLESAREVTNCPQGVDLKEHLKQLVEIRNAAEKLVRCKGRYHSELNYRALAALFGVTTPDLPPLDSETPATYSILREAEAQGVEKFAAKLRIPGDDAFFDGIAEDIADVADSFAKQLREGKA